MFKLNRLSSAATLVMVSGCDVQVQDTTPAEFTANHDIGMYEVSATVTRGALVPQGSVFLFALGDNNQKVTLDSNADGSQFQGLYSARCREAFPLQFLAEWRLQGFEVRYKVVPAQPRRIRLLEPPLTRSARFESAGREPGGGWQGSVQYRFVTEPSVQISAAHLEPAGGSAADAAAVRPMAVASTFPLVAGCGDLAEIRLTSSAARARGTLVIDTDDPAVPHWQTTVEFSPP